VGFADTFRTAGGSEISFGARRGFPIARGASRRCTGAIV
jgi:hypothetical protein